MRAICGAIVAAGALIGLGLTSLGFGQRYALQNNSHTIDGQPVILHLSQMDLPLIFSLMFLTCISVIGLGVMFLGLGYHHIRREREHVLHQARFGKVGKI